jgi:hypothetical protein
MSEYHTPLRADLAAVLALSFLLVGLLLPLPLAAGFAVGFSAIWELADARDDDDDDDGNAALWRQRALWEITTVHTLLFCFFGCHRDVKPVMFGDAK